MENKWGVNAVAQPTTILVARQSVSTRAAPRGGKELPPSRIATRSEEVQHELRIAWQPGYDLANGVRTSALLPLHLRPRIAERGRAIEHRLAVGRIERVDVEVACPFELKPVARFCFA